MKYFYSSEKKGHFDIQGYMGNGLEHILLLMKMVNMIYRIWYYYDKDNLNNIKLSLENTNFIKLPEYVFTNNKYNHKVIALFKKTFERIYLNTI